MKSQNRLLSAVERKKVVKALIDFSNTQEMNSEENLGPLIPNEFLIGVMFDRVMRYKRSWKNAEVFCEKYGNDNNPVTLWKRLSKMKEEDMEKIMKSGNNGKAFHRLQGTFIKGLPKAAALILEKYNGHPEKIWKYQRNPKSVEARFDEIPNIGPALAIMATRILVKTYGYIGGEKSYRLLDVKADVHVTRVFKRAGLSPADATSQDIVKEARKLYPKDPSILDVPSWEIGQKWCRPKKPKCKECVLKEYCLRLTKIR